MNHVSAIPSSGKALSYRTMHEATLQTLREMIISGELAIGEPLRQDELAAQLGISRTPLREALRTLSTEGLVQTHAHRGAVVARPSPQQLLDTYQVREALEVVAGREAAERSTREHANSVARVLGEISTTTDPDQWAVLNSSFHALIYSIVPNAQLIQLVEMMRNRSELYIRILARQQEPTQHAGDDHEQMLAALRRNDADAMEAIIVGHLRATTSTVLPLLDQPR
jgi:DNA-binding GntR family transcriptional regulator